MDKVCMFVTNSVVADSRVIREAAALASSGREVVVVAMHDGEPQPRVERMDGFTVRRVRRDPLARGYSPPSSPGSPAARRTGGLLRIAPALADFQVRAAWTGWRERARVYHAHDLSTLPAAWIAARLAGGRLVYDAHELFTEIGRLPPAARAALRVVERALIGRADRVITVNDSIAGELARRYRVPTPRVVRNCPRTGGRMPSREGSSLRARAGLPEGARVVLYQGMLMPHRGLENLVRAAPLFHDAHLVLMGWGPLRDALETLVAEVGAAPNVRLVDGVPVDELLAVTAGADIGAVPYRNIGLNNYYTSPNKLFEYLVAGVPVVASRLPELVRVVDGEGVGRTFDPEEPASIADAVNALFDDPAALERVRAAVASVRHRYTWESECRTLLEVYASLAESAHPAAAPQPVG
jgi:glycosyltransferase involved in cell wall biosynthesis